MWHPPGVGFLVCGGPSLRTLDISQLAERGIVSLGVNNAAGFAPCRAWCFSDPQYKFHHGLFLDPAIMTFAPTPKLGKHVRIKEPSQPDGFAFTDITVADCPNTWGFQRRTVFDPETFLSTPWSHWGFGGSQGVSRSFSNINTMFCGIRLLHYLGIRTLFMVGVDFSRDETHRHYAWDQEKGNGGGAWRKSTELLRRLRPAIEHAGLHVYNCNPRSALEVFDYVPFSTALELARCAVPKGSYDLSGWYNKRPVRAAKERMKSRRYHHYKLSRAMRNLATRNLAPVRYPVDSTGSHDTTSGSHDMTDKDKGKIQ